MDQLSQQYPLFLFISLLIIVFVIEQSIYRVWGREDRFDIVTVLCGLCAIIQFIVSLSSDHLVHMLSPLIWVGIGMVNFQFSEIPIFNKKKTLFKAFLFFVITIVLVTAYLLLALKMVP